MSEDLEHKSNLHHKASEHLGLVVAKDNDIQINGTNIRLDLIDDFKELGDRQQRYLQRYAEEPNNKTLVAMELGYSPTEVKSWFKQDTFSEVANTIRDIYTEALKDIDFKDAVHNSKIRARVIKAQENDGKYTEKKEGSKHLHLNGTSVSDLAKLLGKS